MSHSSPCLCWLRWWGGFGLETADFVVAGVTNIAPYAGMFVFAILYFGIVSDAGMFVPIVDMVLRVVGNKPSRIVPGTTLLAAIAMLDGSGATTFLIVIPAVAIGLIYVFGISYWLGFRESRRIDASGIANIAIQSRALTDDEAALRRPRLRWINLGLRQTDNKKTPANPLVLISRAVAAAESSCNWPRAGRRCYSR